MSLRTAILLLVSLLSISARFPAWGALPAPAHTVTLAWNSSPSGSIAGYRLYYGTSTHVYTNLVDTGGTTTATVPLNSGVTYFFAVTAYDAIGLESEFSTEVSYTVPSSATLHLSLSGAGNVNLTGSAPSGYQYEVLRTDDLQTWTSVGNVTAGATGAFQFTDTLENNPVTRCYRLQQTSP